MDMSFAWIEVRPGVSNLECDTVLYMHKHTFIRSILYIQYYTVLKNTYL